VRIIAAQADKSAGKLQLSHYSTGHAGSPKESSFQMSSGALFLPPLLFASGKIGPQRRSGRFFSGQHSVDAEFLRQLALALLAHPPPDENAAFGQQRDDEFGIVMVFAALPRAIGIRALLYQVARRGVEKKDGGHAKMAAPEMVFVIDGNGDACAVRCHGGWGMSV